MFDTFFETSFLKLLRPFVPDPQIILFVADCQESFLVVCRMHHPFFFVTDINMYCLTSKLSLKIFDA